MEENVSFEEGIARADRNKGQKLKQDFFSKVEKRAGLGASSGDKGKGGGGKGDKGKGGGGKGGKPKAKATPKRYKRR